MDFKEFLDSKAEQYNRPEFIENDPVCIPHLFKQKQDIEISGFIASVFAWGQRKTIIKKCENLFERMDYAPYQFVKHHSEKDLARLLSFKHRTFNSEDLFYFMEFFKDYYSKNDSLEDAFARHVSPRDETVENGLVGFRNLFFSLPNFPERTLKHIATPAKNSSCKRINMFLRWMVRKDNNGVDFGIWQKLKPSQLLCPEDIHVGRVARKLGLISTLNSNWKTTLELTANLKKLDPQDPVKYDFALFGLGVMEGFGKEEV